MSNRHNKVGDIYALLERAEQQFEDMDRAYSIDLEAKEISTSTKILTHELLEKCSNILDQTMTVCYEQEIKPHLNVLPKKGGYFPIAMSEEQYASMLGQWGASKLGTINPNLDNKLRSLQPFTSPKNNVLHRLRELANKKHTGLVPQKKYQQRMRTVVSSNSGSVTWGPGVTFGPGVSVQGVPINPHTQLPIHSHGIDVQVETWTGFRFEDGGEDALELCNKALNSTRKVVGLLLD